MLKKFLGLTLAALTLMGGAALPASASYDDDDDEYSFAVLTSTLEGPVAASYSAPSTVTGDLYLEIDEPQVVAGMKVNQIEIELPSSITFSAIATISVTGDDGDTCNVSFTRTFVGRKEFKAYNVGCTDTNLNGVVEATVALEGITALNRRTLAATYKIEAEYESQKYRVGRKMKAYEFEIEEPVGVILNPII